MNKTIVGMGEVLWDVLPEGKKIGGAPANFAYHVSQFGLPSCVVSAVGPDSLGRGIVDSFDSKGLTHIIEHVPFPTGTVQVDVDERGIPRYDITPDVAWDNIPWTHGLEQLARNTGAVCFGSLAQRNTVSRHTINRFIDAVSRNNSDALIVFDINLRQHFYNKEIIEDSIERCNILKINDEELEILNRLLGGLGADILHQCHTLIRRYNLRILILTCGINGSYVITPDKVSYLPTPKVEVADTVGAGDSFTAAFISSLLKGTTVEEAHSRAVETSAFVCTSVGAMPILPSHLTK